MVESGVGTDGLFVAPDDVQDVGRFAYKIAQDLLDALRSAGAEVDGLMSGGWKGSAAGSYEAGWRELYDGGIQIFEALTDMAELLGVTADGYRQQDNATSGSLSSLRLD